MNTKDASDLFELQLKFENCLRLLAKKHKELSKKLSSNLDDKKDEKLKISDMGERRSSSEGKPYKKIKLASEKSQKSSLSARAKGKRTQPAKSQSSGFPEKSSDIPKTQKNDSNRFWAYLDCYCADITSEDVKVLEKWTESHDTDAEYQNIPELGIHYSIKWVEDEILEERKEGSKSMENPKGSDVTSEENGPETEHFKKIQNKICSSNSDKPPLVEKLISSFVQENIISSPNDIMTELIKDDDIQEKKIEKASQPEITLETRLKSQLAEIGVLEQLIKTDADNEVLQELKRLQSLLIPICDLNLQKKKALLLRAKAEIAKQEAQKRIQETDVKVMESYRTMAAARLKGKKLSKKELSQIKNMLEERDTLCRTTKIDSTIHASL